MKVGREENRGKAVEEGTKREGHEEVSREQRGRAGPMGTQDKRRIFNGKG